MTGWGPMPLALKVLFVVILLWIAMSIMAVVSMPDREIVFFGALMTGTPATSVVLVLDVLAPLVFLYATWQRLPWGANFGLAYNGIFVLNQIVALIMFSDKFGNAIWFPLIAGIVFVAVIYSQRGYYAQAE